jgi:hypothetical protein
MKLYKIKKIVDGISIGVLIIAYISFLVGYVTLCTYNIKWLWGIPFMLVFIGIPIFAQIISDDYRWQDPWDSDDLDVIQNKLKHENKRLKKVIDIQNRLKYAKIL